VGVGRSQFGSDVVNHVLGSFDPQESKHLDKIVETAIKAVVTILCKGAKEGMNRFNRFKTII
jgi:PTH1 family peptidyl-tRNA hydrolase